MRRGFNIISMGQVAWQSAFKFNQNFRKREKVFYKKEKNGVEYNK